VLVLNGEYFNIVASLTDLIHRRLIKDVQQDAEIQNSVFFMNNLFGIFTMESAVIQ
jgi:hypothetical protein